jgi:hypothetical protein
MIHSILVESPSWALKAVQIRPRLVSNRVRSIDLVAANLLGIGVAGVVLELGGCKYVSRELRSEERLLRGRIQPIMAFWAELTP